MRCTSCGKENRPGARFCDGCGSPLPDAGSGGATPGRASRAERRQLSVIFCDLIGSTRLSQTLDPEELRDLLKAYQDAATEAIRRLGGKTWIFLGDGILTYFGYPDALEDDVERSVRAALAIVEGVRRLNAGGAAAGRPALHVRLAVHTGDVVVGELDAAGAGVFGETPNVAARLQALAPTDGVVVSEATYRLVEGLFRVEPLGPRVLAGVERPVEVFRVLGPSGVRSRFAGRGRRETPLVGRDAEADALWGAWEDARASGGRSILIQGEAGMGKSRLVQAFHDRVRPTPHTWLECGGNPYIRDSAFEPVIHLQATALRFAPGMPDHHRLALLEDGLGRAGFSLAETVPLLARLHSIDIPRGSPYHGTLEGFTPDAVRRETKRVALEWLLRVGHEQPVVLLVEDLHWVDPSTVELLGEIVRRLGETRAFLILTARPDFLSPWHPGTVPSLVLGPLDEAASAHLAELAAGERELPPEELRRIVARTDGVPLFIEEMTRAALESPTGGGGETPGVPPTLKGLLMARIDRLGTARAVAQMGAVIGRDFSHDLIRTVWGTDDGPLDEGLERLVESELVTTGGSAGNPVFEFRHALIQETAYESLLKATRRRYHGRIATALESHFAEVVETRPELVAWHLTEAREAGRAVPYWDRAGQRSMARSENLEAERYLRAGLSCVEHLPPGVERTVHELLFRTRLGASLISVRGYGASEVEENVNRALTLCAELGRSPLIFPVLYNLWVFHLVRGDRKTIRLADELLDFAEEIDPERFATWGHVAQAITHYWQGRFARAREHARLCRESYRHDPDSIPLFGDDAGAYGYVYQGLPLWFMGFPDEAVAQLEAAREMADRIGYAFTVAGTHAFTAQLHHFARDIKGVQEAAARTIDVSMLQGFPIFLGTSLAHAGWGELARGRVEEGRARIRQGVEIYRSTGARLNLPYLKSIIAEGHLVVGDRSGGLAAVDEAIELAREALDRYYVPELHRLRGELLLLGGEGVDAARTCFQEAAASARLQDSRMLELRATVSLSRLLEGEGRREDARAVLGDVYGRFSEGFESPDLRDAARLLAILE